MDFFLKILIKRIKRRKYFLNFCLLIFAITISLFMAEAISRIFIPKDYLMGVVEIYEPSETRGWEHKPNSEIIFNDLSGNKEFSQYVKINSKGLRDYEYDYEKSDDTFRIVMLGDSMTAALEVPLKETFETILEKKLNENYKKKYSKYEVLNLGVKKYGTQQEFIALEEEGIKYQPDLVILNFFVGNDFLNNAKSSIFILENGDLIKNPDIEPIKFARIRSFLSKNLALYNLLSRVKSSMGTTRKEEFNKFIEVIKPESKRKIDLKPDITYLTIKKLNNFLNERNIDFVIVILPIKEQVDENKLKELLEDYNSTEIDLDLEWSIRKLKYFGELEDIPVINILPEMKKVNIDNDFYFNTDMHFTKSGNRIVGELIYKHLLEKNLIW